MELHPRVGRVHLQIERRRLGGLLLLAGELGEAVSERVGDAEVHVPFLPTTVGSLLGPAQSLQTRVLGARSNMSPAPVDAAF